MEQQQSGYTLRDIFYVLFKRKWMIIIFFAATLIAAFGFTMMFSLTLYQATAQILVSPGREHLTDFSVSSNTAMAPRLSFDLEEQSSRTIAMLTGRYLAEQVVRKIGARQLCYETRRWTVPLVSSPFCGPALDDESLVDRVVGQLQDHIHAERVGSAALVNLSYTHPDPAIAAAVVNALGALYLDRHLGVLKAQRSEAFVQAQSATLKERMGQSESELEAFKRENGIHSSVKDEQAMIAAELGTLEVLRNDIASHVADEQSRLSRRDRAGAGASNSQVVVDMRSRLLDLRRKESELAARLGDRNPELMALREDIGRLGLEIGQQERIHHQTEAGALTARQVAVQSRIAELRKRLQTVDRLDAEFSRLQQRLQVDQQNYRLYQAKTEESRVSDEMDAQKIASVRMIDSAHAPLHPLGSKTTLLILVAAVFGLLGAIVVAFLLEIFADRLETPERAENVLDVPVLASIPVLRMK